MATKIPLTAITSSNLAAIGYDELRQIVAVQFKNADIWHYAGVPASVWYDFQEASSKGSFYAKTIRGHYPGEKMTGSCPKCGDTGWLGEPCADRGCAVYTGPVKHALIWDHPTARAPRQRAAYCGVYAAPTAFAADLAHVTCAACKEVLAEREAIAGEESLHRS